MPPTTIPDFNGLLLSLLAAGGGIGLVSVYVTTLVVNALRDYVLHREIPGPTRRLISLLVPFAIVGVIYLAGLLFGQYRFDATTLTGFLIATFSAISGKQALFTVQESVKAANPPPAAPDDHHV